MQHRCPNCGGFQIRDNRTLIDPRNGRPVASPALVFLVSAFIGLAVGMVAGVVLVRTLLDLAADADILIYAAGLVGAAVGLLLAYQRTKYTEQRASILHRLYCNTCRHIWTWQER